MSRLTGDQARAVLEAIVDGDVTAVEVWHSLPDRERSALAGTSVVLPAEAVASVLERHEAGVIDSAAANRWACAIFWNQVSTGVPHPGIDIDYDPDYENQLLERSCGSSSSVTC